MKKPWPVYATIIYTNMQVCNSFYVDNNPGSGLVLWHSVSSHCEHFHIPAGDFFVYHLLPLSSRFCIYNYTLSHFVNVYCPAFVIKALSSNSSVSNMLLSFKKHS